MKVQIRTITLTGLLFGCSVISLGQTNLVPNGGFEAGGTAQCWQYSQQDSDNESYQDSEGWGFNDDVDYWSAANYKANCKKGDCASPNYVDTNTCFNFDILPFKVGAQSERWIYMVGFDWAPPGDYGGEGIRVGLRKSGGPYQLIPGKEYILSFLVSRGGSSNPHIRVHFAKKGAHWNQNCCGNQKWSDATTFIMDDATYDANTWYYVEKRITCPSDKDELENMIIQMNNEGNIKIAIDEVRLYEVNVCEDTQYIQNKVHWNEDKIYQAGEFLIAGEDVTPYAYDQTGSVEVKYNSHIIYRANTSIILEPGFQTEMGAYFETVIEPCEGNPCPSEPFIPDVVQACNGDPIQIGHGGETGLMTSWTPATYLDDPNIANPTFTPPSGSGYITYDVTITSICGAVWTDQVTVYYSDSPNPIPTVGMFNIYMDDYTTSFDATVSPATEYAYVSVYNLTTGSLEWDETLYQGIDFSGTSYSWQIPEMWLTMCHDYRIAVSTKNICSSSIATDSYDWIRNGTPTLFVPNVFSPNGDGVNDELCITTNGVDLYDIYVTNNSGTYIYSASGEITSNTTCIWGGECTGSTCSGGCIGSPGTYFVIVNVYNCTSPAAVTETMAVFVSELDCGTVGMSLQTPDPEANISLNEDGETLALVTDIANPSEGSSFNVFPNPGTGQFTVELATTEPGTLQVYSALGQVIETVRTSVGAQLISLDLTHEPNGVYYLTHTTSGGTNQRLIMKH